MSKRDGYTLIEILLVMALLGVLAGLTVVSLRKPQLTSSLVGLVGTLTADLKSQQIKAMSGDSAGTATSQSYGVFIESNKYTTFKGASYSAVDPDNFVINADPGITITTSLPSSQVVFQKFSGEPAGWASTTNSITIANTSTGEAKTIAINRYGMIAVSNGNNQWLSGWGYRKEITIDQTVVDADLTSFPVLVKLTNTNFDFAKARADGFDIRFTRADGATPLAYERERHISGTAEYWVNVPLVSGSVNTTFYVYYGNASAADAQDVANVWDANYLAVWHKKESPTAAAPQFFDSSGLGGNGTANGMVVGDQQVGQIGGSIRYNGTSAFSDVGTTHSVRGLTQFTYEGWITVGALGARRTIFEESRGATSPVTRMKFSLEPANTFALAGRSTDAGGYTTWVNPAGVTAVADGRWYSLAAVYNSVTDVHSMWIDGTEYTNSVVAATISNTAPLGTSKMGRRADAVGEYWNGKIDEFRISNTARSDPWLKASYHSGKDTLLGLGAEETD